MEHEIIQIPYDKLSSDALIGLIESFILREGTDYGHNETSMETKKEQVLNQIHRGQVVITYDQELETCHLLTLQDFKLKQSAQSNVCDQS